MNSNPVHPFMPMYAPTTHLFLAISLYQVWPFSFLGILVFYSFFTKK